MTPAMKPDDIPEDVWEVAENSLDLMLCNCIGASGSTEQLRADSISDLSRAIMAERERCAKIAEGFEQTRDWVPGSLYDTLRREVAAAIRQER